MTDTTTSNHHHLNPYTVSCDVDAAIADMTSPASGATHLWWTRNPDVVAHLAANSDLAAKLRVDAHTWLHLDHPDAIGAPTPRVDVVHDRIWDNDHSRYRHAADICHAAADHAIARRQWTNHHQQLVADNEQHLAAHTDPEIVQLTTDWQMRAARLLDDHPHITVSTDGPWYRDDNPVGLTWSTIDLAIIIRSGRHHIAAQRTHTADDIDRLIDRAATVPHWYATHIERANPNIDLAHIARLHAIAGNTSQFIRWAHRTPEHRAAAIDTISWLCDTHHWAAVFTIVETLVADPDSDPAIVAAIPVELIRDLDPVNSDALRHHLNITRNPDSSGAALWDSWDGTVGDLADTARHIDNPPS